MFPVPVRVRRKGETSGKEKKKQKKKGENFRKNRRVKELLPAARTREAGSGRNVLNVCEEGEAGVLSNNTDTGAEGCLLEDTAPNH